MQSFNVKNIKTPTFKQNNQTIAGRLSISTKNNKAVSSPMPANFTFRSGLMREVIPIAGFTNGVANGSIVQTIGNEGWAIDCEILVSYGDYIPLRNRIVQILQGNRAFALQTFTTQQNQTIPILNGTKNNYFYGFATDITFKDTFNGKILADGSDSISFTFHEVPELKKPKKKRSIFSVLDKAVNFLDQVQANIGFATLSLQGVSNTLIETAKSISNYASGVSSFIQEMNQLQNSVGTLVKSPNELAQNYVSAIKSFQGLFSSGDPATQKQYYAPLKSLVEYNQDTEINRAKIRQADGSFLNVYDNIEKNIILGKTTTFMRATALLILCNNYENYIFSNTAEAFEAWQNVINLFNFFATETKFDGLPANANISSNFTNSVFEPEAFESVRDYVYQTLESIRVFIFSQNDFTVESTTETSNVYEIVAKKYGSLDKLEEFFILNQLTSYSQIIKGGTQLKFN